MCEVMERYQAKAVREGEIIATVESAVAFNASRAQAIKQLMNKYQLSEAEAAEQCEKYAPTLV